MRKWMKNPVNSMWCLLMGITCLSFYQGPAFHGEIPGYFPVALALLMFLTFFKVWIVMRHFMEIRHAPIALRLLCDAWIAICCGGIFATYWFGAVA